MDKMYTVKEFQVIFYMKNKIKRRKSPFEYLLWRPEVTP